MPKKILTGVDDEAARFAPRTPRSAEQGISEDEAKDVVAYLKSIPAVKRAVPESSCPPIK